MSIKILNNGEIGIEVSMEHIQTLNTVDSVDAELNKVSLGGYEPVVRDGNPVVGPAEYLEYLKGRKLELLAVARQTQTVHPAPVIQPRSPLKPEVSDNESLMMAEMKRKDEVIGRLLSYAKSIDASESSCGVDGPIVDVVYYDGELSSEGTAGNVSVKAPLRNALIDLVGSNKISEYANIAIARGLLGEVAAEEYVTDTYGDGVYEKFLESVGG